MTNQIIIGMAGHIDHGKTSIVEALTGINTDILDQEKERGMTIDIGFAHFSNNITIIDVPGHEKFIKNMVTGVSYIDFAILVIAADDGVMPQTKEHFEILKILNVEKGVVVINKIDLVDEEWLKLVELDVQDLIDGSFLNNQKIYKVSTTENLGIDELKSCLQSLSSINSLDLNNDRGLFRLYIDRSFSQQGFGTVVTGTAISGAVDVGESLVALPASKTVRLRSAQSHHKNVQTISVRDRAALNLNGIELKEIGRGGHLSNLEAFKPISMFLATISLLDIKNASLSQNQRLRFHIGTSEVIGRISICSENIVDRGDSCICLIKLEKSVIIAFKDKFLIRSYSPMRTIGGGVVEDIDCIGKWKSIKEYASKLIKIDSVENKMNFIIESRLGFPLKFIDIQMRFGMSFDKVISCLNKNKKYKLIEFQNEKWIVTYKQLETFLDIVVKSIEDFHSKNPYRSGVLKKELYQKVKSDILFFDFCIGLLIDQEKIERDKEIIRIKGFKINLSTEEIAVQEKVLNILDEQGFCSQNYIQIASSLNISAEKLKLLINIAEKDQKIIRINEDLLFTSKNFNILINDIKKYFSHNEKLSVSSFKDIAKTSRKYAVPLLEYLDKKNITYRQENFRKLV